jgi:CRP-like cAMP-binding protein
MDEMMIIGLREGDWNIIRQTAILGGLRDEALNALLADAAIKTLDSHETVFLQGEPAKALFVVLDGWVKIYRIAPTGDEAVVAVFTRGQSFAEAAAFTGGVYPASAETVTDCRLLFMPAQRLFDRICESPEIGLSMLASTSMHLHALVQQIEQLKAHTGAQRVGEFLLSLAPIDEGACTIALPYDKVLIAGRLGMKPESLSRAFQRLKGLGVKINQNMATLGDVKALRKFVEQERAEVLRPRRQGCVS